jgi:hypothetical protein
LREKSSQLGLNQFEAFAMSRRVSVPLDAVLLGFVERAAERESRTVEGQIRHFIIEAMRDTGSPTAGLEPWPLPLALVNRESLSEIKGRMKDMEVERDNLEAAERTNQFGFMPHDEVRLRYLRDSIKSLQSHIAAIERLTDANDLI